MATARRFEDLHAWKLAQALRDEIFRLTGRPKVIRDKGFCDDIHRSARSAPANIAEGFGLYDPKPNARHVSIAKGSLEETLNHIDDGFKRNHFDVTERDALVKLARRALIATTRYLRYLRSCKAAPPGKPYAPEKRHGEPEPREPEPGEPEPGEPEEPEPGNPRNP
jgi:four helix bundle protein